jgi:quercetin dioxygenase-like cupin family protein
MEIARGSEMPFEEGGEDRFTGTVWMNPGLTAADGTAVVVVSFDPGARTHWHSHPGGQFLVAISGRGRVGVRGEQPVDLEAGDILVVAPGEEHWHGAGPAAPLVHVAVNGGGPPVWGEPVRDADYFG